MMVFFIFSVGSEYNFPGLNFVLYEAHTQLGVMINFI